MRHLGTFARVSAAPQLNALSGRMRASSALQQFQRDDLASPPALSFAASRCASECARSRAACPWLAHSTSGRVCLPCLVCTSECSPSACALHPVGGTRICVSDFFAAERATPYTNAPNGGFSPCAAKGGRRWGQPPPKYASPAQRAPRRVDHDARELRSLFRRGGTGGVRFDRSSSLACCGERRYLNMLRNACTREIS